MQKTFCRLALLVCLLGSATLVNTSVITTLNNSDPAPIYDSNFPFAYLYDGTRDFLNRDSSTLWEQGVEFSITPYFDKANSGWDKCGKKCPGPDPANDTNLSGITPSSSTLPVPVPPVPNPFFLGDIAGRWNILALLPYGSFSNTCGPSSGESFFITSCPSSWNAKNPKSQPTSCEDDKSTSTCADITCVDGCTDLPDGSCGRYAIPYELGQIALNALNCMSSASPLVAASVQDLLVMQGPDQTFGFLSVKTKFRKEGARFRGAAMLTKGFGMSVQTGISHLTNCADFIDPTAPQPDPNYVLDGATVTNNGLYDYTTAGVINPFANSTTNALTPAISSPNWWAIVSCLHTELMQQFNPVIAKLIGIDISDYEATSIDDIRGELFWRYMIELNKNNDSAWPDCAIMPFFAAGYTLGAAKGTDPDKPLSVAFGNNGHNAGDFNAGVSLFFYESCEIGFEGGGTFFMAKQKDGLRVPNNAYQNIIYPYKTNVKVAPGTTWHMGAFLNSRHFDNHFSMHFQYLYINHMEDKYKLCCNNTNKAFTTSQLEDNSAWRTQLCNIALSYDVSPGCMISVKGQMPFSGANVYKTNTISFSLEFVH